MRYRDLLVLVNLFFISFTAIFVTDIGRNLFYLYFATQLKFDNEI
jgi:hypothetical protein